MSFSIYQLDELDTFDENALWNYRDSLIRLFVQSPDGQAYSGFWVDNLVYYGYVQLGITLPHMTVEHVDYVVTKLFPVNVSLNAPEEADGAIPELLAFWHYLKFEYDLPQADAISVYLADLGPRFRGIMISLPRFDVAPAAPVVSEPDHYELTEDEDADDFEDDYDDDLDEYVYGSSVIKRSREENARLKKKRKAAKAARKKGRKH